MKLFILTALLLTSSVTRANNQPVFFPNNTDLNSGVKSFIQKVVNLNCKKAIRSGSVEWESTEVIVDEYDQGKFDYYYNVKLVVDYNTDQIPTDEITLLVEEYDIANPRFEKYYLESLQATGNVCDLYN
ncbi:MAG: hypothetical protein GY909_16660 [Oligoflexia bacterium]|nr:hypothetical protein [Oligoflexia bacterium]